VSFLFLTIENYGTNVVDIFDWAKKYIKNLIEYIKFTGFSIKREQGCMMQGYRKCKKAQAIGTCFQIIINLSSR
jgi:hypothetical protein